MGQNHIERQLRHLFAWYKGEYVLIVRKKQRRLFVCNKNGIVTSYPVGIGSNPDMKAKLHEKDNRTPEGQYHITEIQSLNAPPESESFKKLTRMNNVYFSAKFGRHKYNKPNVDLGNNIYGPRFYRLNYPNKEDKKRYEQAMNNGKLPLIEGEFPGIGSGIAIHGTNDKSSIGHLCSRGCIRMHNKDIIELEKYIKLQTPVLIYT